jgi:hypothetical protein
VVELTIFSNAYADGVWALNPLRARNNLQHVGDVDWEEYISLKDSGLVRRQKDFARKVIQETVNYDNIYYEICNEPGGGTKGHVSPEEVDAWQEEMARVLRDEMRRLNKPHLLSGQQAFTYAVPNAFPMDATFAGRTFDIVNDHPLPNTQFGGQVYGMGNFMSKELMLDGIKGYCLATYSSPKPDVLDEDNAASLYRDMTGWTIHRKRAWTALLNGSHYDYIDFSITIGSETGTTGSQQAIRPWMQHLSEFMTSFDFIHSRPDQHWISGYPEFLVASGLSVISGTDYVAYLADARELGAPGAGEAIAGSIVLTLPPGSYTLRFYSPVTGKYFPPIAVKGGGKSVLALPRFIQDLVIRITRRPA